MRNSIVLIIIAAATAAVAGPIITLAATNTSVSAEPTAIFPNGFTISVPDSKDQEAEELDPYYSEGTTTDEDLDHWYSTTDDEFSDAADDEQPKVWKRAEKKRDAKRKHGVVCTVL